MTESESAALDALKIPPVLSHVSELITYLTIIVFRSYTKRKLTPLDYTADKQLYKDMKLCRDEQIKYPGACA